MSAPAQDQPAAHHAAAPPSFPSSAADRLDPERAREPAQKLWGSVLVPNNGSTARDYCARERNFLSMIKTATILALVSASLLIRFQFGEQVSMPQFERYAQTPLGVLFFVACLVTLAAGTFTFYSTLSGYEHRRAFVYAGRSTDAALVGVTVLIFTTCVVLLVANA
ncbi:hypothetical protein JCM3775_003099 [Rhodotorula graminis]